MERTLYLTELFDIYGELFTDKQKEYFIDYYFNNYTLQEISENYNVTRNAVHKSLKETEEKLMLYEEKFNVSNYFSLVGGKPRVDICTYVYNLSTGKSCK